MTPFNYALYLQGNKVQFRKPQKIEIIDVYLSEHLKSLCFDRPLLVLTKFIGSKSNHVTCNFYPENGILSEDDELNLMMTTKKIKMYSGADSLWHELKDGENAPLGSIVKEFLL